MISHIRTRLHLTGGDGFGWALDEDLRTFSEALPAGVELVGLDEAEVVYSPWWEGLAHLGTDALLGKRVLCGFDNPLFHWITRPRFRAVRDVVGLWVAHTEEAAIQARSVGLACEVVPYAVRTETFHPIPGLDRAALRHRWGLPEKAFVIGNFQRDSEGSNLLTPKLQKGPDLFAEILKALHDAGYPVHVVLAGPRRHWLRCRLTEHGVPFTLLGKVSEGDDLKINILSREALNELYQALDLYLLTSRWEGGPYALLEAAATRCRIISTRVGLAAELLEPECIADDISSAVPTIAREIEAGTLLRTVEPQWQRVHDRHTPAALRPRVAQLFDRIAGVPAFAGVPARAVGTLPKAKGSSFTERIRRVARRFIPERSAGAGLSVSIFREYVKPPYGGGNQFMLALRAELLRRGVRVLNNQVGSSIDGYLFDSLWFDQKLLDRLARLSRPKVLHRIDGPIHLYRGKDKELDDRIFEINLQFATTSVIQSVFTLQRIFEAGYRPVHPVVVRNASDPSIFGRVGKRVFDPSEKIRIISTSWSNNPRKGGDAYKWLDQNLDWNRYEYVFLGRASTSFDHINQIDAVPSERLATYLKSSDIYITASQNDPCSNSLIEALSCGLPAVYLRSGGHPELVGKGGLGFDAVEEVPRLLTIMAQYYASFQACIAVPTIAKAADAYLAAMTD